jgi:hypothetical protein
MAVCVQCIVGAPAPQPAALKKGGWAEFLELVSSTAADSPEYVQGKPRLQLSVPVSEGCAQGSFQARVRSTEQAGTRWRAELFR